MLVGVALIPATKLTGLWMRRYLLVFGVELELLLEREADGAEVLPGTIPSAIASCLLEVEARGSSEVGMCESVFLSWRHASMRPRSHCRSYLLGYVCDR